MKIVQSRKFKALFVPSAAVAIFLLLRYQSFEPTTFMAWCITTFVVFNLLLFYERTRLLWGKFDVYDEVVFPCHQCSAFGTYFVAVPCVIVFTAFLPFVPPFSSQVFWVWYALFGFWLAAWNYGTRLIVPKAGTIATKNGVLYRAGYIIFAPLFYPQISLKSANEAEAEDEE